MRAEEIDALLGGEAQRLADQYRSVPVDFMDGYGWAVTQICRLFPDAVPVIRCKDCKHFEYDHFDAVYFPTETGEAERVPLITAHEICTRWGDGCKTDQNGFCFMAERKEE